MPVSTALAHRRSRPGCLPFSPRRPADHPSIASPRTFHGPGRCCRGAAIHPRGGVLGAVAPGTALPGGVLCPGAVLPSHPAHLVPWLLPAVPPLVPPSRRPAVPPFVLLFRRSPRSSRRCPAAPPPAAVPWLLPAVPPRGAGPRKNCSECARCFSKSALQSLIFRENPLFFPERVYLCGRKNGWRECAVCCEIHCGSGCSCCWAARISSSHEAMRSPAPPSVR